MKGVGDERGGGASDHLSGGLGEKRVVRGTGRVTTSHRASLAPSDLLTSFSTCSSEDTVSFLLLPGWKEASGGEQPPKGTAPSPSPPEAPCPPDPGVPPGQREGERDRWRIHPPRPAQPPGTAGEGSAGSAQPRGTGEALPVSPRPQSPLAEPPRGPQRVPISPQYLQHFAVHDGADGAGAEAGGEALEESRSSIDLHDVLGWRQQDPSLPGTPGHPRGTPGQPRGDKLTVSEEAGQLVDLAPEDVPAQGGRQRLVAHLRRGQAAGTGPGVPPPQLPATGRPLPAPAPSRT